MTAASGCSVERQIRGLIFICKWLRLTPGASSSLQHLQTEILPSCHFFFSINLWVVLKMDPDVKKLVILLIWQLSLFTTLECISREEERIFLWHWQQIQCLTLALHAFKLRSGRHSQRLWAHDRGLHKPGFFDQNLLGSFNAREFKGRMRMDVLTFEYLCGTLAPDLRRQDTSMRLAIPVQIKVAISISRLATCNSMQVIADLYRIGLSSSQLVVSQFCGAIKKNLLRKFIN